MIMVYCDIVVTCYNFNLSYDSLALNPCYMNYYMYLCIMWLIVYALFHVTCITVDCIHVFVNNGGNYSGNKTL